MSTFRVATIALAEALTKALMDTPSGMVTETYQELAKCLRALKAAEEPEPIALQSTDAFGEFLKSFTATAEDAQAQMTKAIEGYLSDLKAAADAEQANLRKVFDERMRELKAVTKPEKAAGKSDVSSQPPPDTPPAPPGATSTGLTA